MEKVIVLDYSIFCFRGLFGWRNNKNIPLEYIILNMILSSLQKIGISPYDKIIVARDGKGNWRHDYDKDYKANRKEFRESFEDLNWEEVFGKFDKVADWIDKATDWELRLLDKIEADDIASAVCRYYKDKEIVLVSYDKDWELLLLYPNVKIFSILKKYKGKKGAYKIPTPKFNAYKLLASKVKQEKTDNLVSPVLSEKDYNNRLKCVNLLELPEYIEGQIVKELGKYKEKEPDINYIPFTTIKEKLENLYNSKDKIVTYEECVKYEEKKKKRKKGKK